MLAQPKKRVQTIDRLRQLPPVFTLHTAAAIMGCDPNMASTYVKRWKDSGLCSSLGNRSGVHYNLLVDPHGPSTRRMEAISLVYPGAILGGVSALHLAGWTTQIPTADHIICPPRRSLPDVDGVIATTRDAEWFAMAASYLPKTGDTFVPALHPAFALADCIKTDSWVPDVDEIEWDQVKPMKLWNAFIALDTTLPPSYRRELDAARPS